MKIYTEEEIVELYKDCEWFMEVYKFYKALFIKITQKDKDAFQIAINIVLLNFKEIEEAKFNHEKEILLAMSEKIVFMDKKTKAKREIANNVKVF
ncbi:hypothetical protein DFLDMN_001643 [Cupriavidus sp. H19C3]|uniref:hypothetical protein n=1 Tax=Cupriavidus sp. H19C3 TaxID=3241603 RepID=UPI003BF91F35